MWLPNLSAKIQVVDFNNIVKCKSADIENKANIRTANKCDWNALYNLRTDPGSLHLHRNSTFTGYELFRQTCLQLNVHHCCLKCSSYSQSAIYIQRTVSTG